MTWPTKTDFVDGDVLSAAQVNNIGTNLNVFDPTSVAANKVLTADGSNDAAYVDTITNLIAQGLKESWEVSATAATGTINFDTLTSTAWLYTSNASANWTLNVRGDGSTTLASLLNTGDSITIAFGVTQGGTAYYNSAFQIDGNSITPEWQGGEAPTAGNSSSIDVYVYTIIKTAATPTYTVLASQTQFA